MQKVKKIVAIVLIGIPLSVFLAYLISTKFGSIQPDPKSQSYKPLLNQWKRFSSEEGKFSVLFPGAPKEKTQSGQTAFGQAEVHAFAVDKNIQGGAGWGAYGVSYIDSPKFPDLKLYFDKIQVMEAGEKGQILFQEDMKFENYPSREFEYVRGGKANYSGRIKLIMVGQRLYVLCVIFLTANPNPQERAAFFDSFQLQN